MRNKKSNCHMLPENIDVEKSVIEWRASIRALFGRLKCDRVVALVEIAVRAVERARATMLLPLRTYCYT